MPFVSDDDTITLTVHRSTMLADGRVFEEVISFTQFSLDIKGEVVPFSGMMSYRLEDMVPTFTLSLTGQIDKINRTWDKEEHPV
jgi:hypothetical protein